MRFPSERTPRAIRPQSKLVQAQGTVQDGRRLSPKLLRIEKRHSQTQEIFLRTSELATHELPPPIGLINASETRRFAGVTVSSDKIISRRISLPLVKRFW